MSHDLPPSRLASRVALVTGVGRRRSIGAELALGLAADGWDLALGHWQPYDERLGYERGDRTTRQPSPRSAARSVAGSSCCPATSPTRRRPEALVAAATERLGPVTGLVMSHCESVDSGILTTSLESWERHYAVNARATWLLIRAFAERLPVQAPGGPAAARVVALTSDHTAHNLPYGSSKGALDRIVIAAALELADRGVRANVINPGPIDTGWMDDRDPRARRRRDPGRPARHAARHRRPRAVPASRSRAAGSTASCSTATAASTRPSVTPATGRCDRQAGRSTGSAVSRTWKAGSS